MKKLILILSLVFTGLIAFAQTPADTSFWKKGGIGTLTFSQVSLYQWSAGGENSISGNGLLNLFAKYKKDNISWDNTLDLGYGILKQGSLSKKSDDRIDFSSLFGRKASEKLNYSALLGFKTQFAPGYNYPDDSTVISTAFAPAYITFSLGMAYKPNDNFSLFLSPATGKMTLVLDDNLSAAGAFGVEKDKKSRSEFGGFLKAVYTKTVMKNVDFTTKLDLFSNYFNNPGNIDVNWEVLISMKINEYLAATINTLVLYDDDVMVPREDKNPGPGIQVKDVIGLGFSYKF
jgi:hypothetical protein